MFQNRLNCLLEARFWLERRKRNGIIIMDRGIDGDKVFADLQKQMGYMDHSEYAIYMKRYQQWMHTWEHPLTVQIIWQAIIPPPPSHSWQTLPDWFKCLDWPPFPTVPITPKLRSFVMRLYNSALPTLASLDLLKKLPVTSANHPFNLTAH